MVGWWFSPGTLVSSTNKTKKDKKAKNAIQNTKD
jgi:hypothetical protein